MKLLSFLIAVLLLSQGAIAQSELPLKKRSAFYAPETLSNIRDNLEKHPEGRQLKLDAVKKAAFWKELSDDELWDLMFGPKITRSWMVWSNGDCPACKKSVPMYTWIMEPQKLRWKTRCPHCKELFPKNDFAAFYQSGLDEQSVFDPAQADRKLLFNTEHPDPADPLHQFGVDDGEGYVADGKRWRFIGAYLVYGQFKQLVLGGINALGTAYVFTGDEDYARKAGILLDRVADLYPSFDYATQGLVYEQRNTQAYNGYVSIWHDTCEETHELALGYDQVFEGLRDNTGLVAFLSNKAKNHKLPNPKNTFAAVQQNIENGILRDPLKNTKKIHSNFPRAECTAATLQTVLGWPENRAEVEAFIDTFVQRATAVDGVTGEKGLSGYSSYTISGMANFLAQYSRAEPDFLARLIERQPSLKQTYRFHIDTFCLDRFYPDSGDCGGFGKPANKYVGVNFQKLTKPTLAPSMFSFFWQLYEATGDPAYVQVLHRENGRTLNGLPHDLFVANPNAVRKNVATVIAREGADVELGSINKEGWRIAILRSGTKENARALWLDYDSGGSHGHHDAMTIGLFAHGVNLLPEFGYPPVQFGGWKTEKAQWFLHTAAHNTVTVDGRNHPKSAGKTTLWADGKNFRAISASSPQVTGGRYERTVALVDVSASEFYVLDLFRVAGGTDHAKFVHGPNGKMVTDGLQLKPTDDYGNKTQMRNFQRDTNSPTGWTATWNVVDQHDLIPAGKSVSFRYTDLSSDIQAYTAEAWIPSYFRSFDEEIWNPALMIRRRGQDIKTSTFVSMMEGFERKPAIAKLTRLSLFDAEGVQVADASAAIEVALPKGFTDLIIAMDPELLKSGAVFKQPQWGVELSSELVWIRRDSKKRLVRASFANGNLLKIGNSIIEKAENTEFVEVDFTAAPLKRPTR
ncbi:MAG: heparinase II/III family protein [Verrucomicrobia bacterium]|nr:heparinase II/III family protein [Verrucomicrobiota bacterium]